MDEQTELLREIRDLLRVVAEPALAERDKKLRSALREIVGKSSTKAKAVSLMDGTRSQTALYNQAGMDQGGLSRLVKALSAAELLKGDSKQPLLTISIPPNFFESLENNE